MIDALRALATPLGALDPRNRVVTVAYWDVAPLLPPSYFDRGLAENSTAIVANAQDPGCAPVRRRPR